MKRTTIFTIILMSAMTIQAQLNFSRNGDIPVLKINSDTLDNPWAGGFNSVQFSELDLDLDGIMDLVVLDRTGDRLSTFINDGTPGQSNYKHDPQYLSAFPELNHWALFRDFNCDGKMDIFTYYSGGVRIYKNTSTSSLSFALEDSLVYSNFDPDSITPNMIALFVSGSDLPAIDDIDGDGDLDILTFDVPGSRVVYHKNMAMEYHGVCDSTTFELTNKCWGYFQENALSSAITIFDTCAFNVGNPERYAANRNARKHAGSSLLTLDVDASGSKDLVLGDIGATNMVLLTNSDVTPNLTSSNITAVDTTFPSNNNSTIPVDMLIFPAGYYLDVNNDTIKDLICSTNQSSNVINDDNVWFYENNGADDNPDFSFQNNSFLQDGMIEVGEGANPAFVDYNADGLLDIVVGSYGIFDTTNTPFHKASLWLYENIGTMANPAFQLVTNDYLGISTMNLDVNQNQPAIRLMPAFGDIDGDNDVDLLIGDYFGYVHFFENTAGAGNPVNFVLNQVQYQGIDVGIYASPQIIDLNRDTLVDLVIGNRNGNFKYYENTGTASNPIFTLVADTLGHINTKRFNEFSGNATPLIVEESGNYILLSGSVNGYLYRFGNIDGNLTGTFSVMDSTYKNIWEGSQTTLAGADVNNDGNIDLLIGNYSGGVAYYQGEEPSSIQEIEVLSDIIVYPNPSKGIFQFNFGVNNLRNARMIVTDLIGNTIMEQAVSSQITNLDLSNRASGIYLVRFSNNLGNQVFKLIKE